MFRPANIKRTKLSHRLATVLAAILVLGTGLAQEKVEREGYFEVRSASTQSIAGVHTLDARLQLVLSSEALAALESGVTLTIEMQLQVIRVKRFLSSPFATSLNTARSVNVTSSRISTAAIRTPLQHFTPH